MNSAGDGAVKKNPILAVFLAWLIPGAGHWYLGRRFQAVLFFSVLLCAFSAGFSMGELRIVTSRDHPYYFLGQIFLGLPTLVASWVTSGMEPFGAEIPGLDMGFLYTTCAGLLNALVIMDAHDLGCRSVSDASGQRLA